MHQMQEMFSLVEVSLGLITNRKRDAEIKLDELKAKMQSRRCVVEGLFDDFIEKLGVLKGQILESIDLRDAAGSKELKTSIDDFHEKLLFLVGVQDQVKEIQGVATAHQLDYKDEHMLGFFFANQDKIRKFIDEENEQKMMNKLRSHCDSLDSKSKHFVASELQKYREEIEKAIPEIFAQTGLAAPQATAQKTRLEEAEDRVRQLSKPAAKETTNGLFQQRPSSAHQDRQADGFPGSHQPDASPLADHTRSSILARDRQAGGPVSSKLLSRSRMAEIPRAQFEAERTLEKFENSLFKKTDRKHPQKTVAPDKPEDPLLSIQKKLAMFDVRAAQKRCAVLTEPALAREWRAPREAHLDPRPDPASLLGLEQDRTPNIENLRNFRQKMRERYTREPIGSLRNRSIYSTH